MILLAPALIYIFALTCVYGSVAIITLDKLLVQPNKPIPSVSVVNITGTIVLAVIAGYLSLFMKIGMVVNIVTLIAAIVLYLAHRNGN